MAKRSILKLVTGSYDEPEMDEDEELGEETEKSDEEPWVGSEGQLTIDVYQNGDEMVIKSTIAGVAQEDLDITIANDMVTIRGDRKRADDIDPEDYYYQELYWGPFSRSVVLPHEVDTESARANLKDGILTIRLPKIERTKTKKIKFS
jgi:HSP20 family protein